MSEETREGEVTLPGGTLEAAPSERVVFIGRIRSPWKTRREAPHNLREARERGMERARVEVDAPFRPGLFSLRSPARPNPIGIGVVEVLAIDEEAGIIEIDAIDCLGGTPLVDIKPYLARVDSVPEATPPYR
mgnify:CR=1 FL=1